VAEEHSPHPQFGSAKPIDSDGERATGNGLKDCEDAGGGECGPRRSAEGRSAGGVPASEASSGAAKGVRLGGAERSSKANKKPDYCKNNPVSIIRMAPNILTKRKTIPITAYNSIGKELRF